MQKDELSSNYWSFLHILLVNKSLGFDIMNM